MSKRQLTEYLRVRVLAIAASRCVSNGSTADMNPDPFWNFPVIVLLGESENRLSIIIGSIPIFWPVVEDAVERVVDFYRITITQEFIVHSSRVLPGEVTVDVGAYEAPQWAEDAFEGDAARRRQSESEASNASNGDGDGGTAGDKPETKDAGKDDVAQEIEEIALPAWPGEAAEQSRSREGIPEHEKDPFWM